MVDAGYWLLFVGFVPQRRIPDLNFAFAFVAATRGQVLAVRAENHALDRAGKATQRADLLAGVRIPDDDFLPARRGQAQAIGAKGGGNDGVSMSWKVG